MIRTFRAVLAGAALATGTTLAAAPAAAQTYQLRAQLDGLQQNPDVITPATATATMLYTPNFGNPALGSLSVVLQVNNLSSPLQTVAGSPGHIHVGPREVNGPVIIPFLGLTPGLSGTFTYNNTFTLSALNLTPEQLAGVASFNTQLQAASVGQELPFYVNLHTVAHPGGEVRGQIGVVPEPSTYALLGTGMAAVGMVARRRRQRA